MLQVTYGTTVQYISSQLLRYGINEYTPDMTAALCVKVPNAASALATPVFSIIGALDSQIYGITATSNEDWTLHPGANDGAFSPTNLLIGYFGPTSFSPAGATPEAVPPAFSQYATTLALSGLHVESSIWSMTADTVPVISPHWVN